MPTNGTKKNSPKIQLFCYIKYLSVVAKKRFQDSQMLTS